MSNMRGYFRFQDALLNVEECLNHINDDVSITESVSRRALVEKCQDVVDEYDGKKDAWSD